MAEKMFPISAAKNSAIFLAEKEQTKKRDTLERMSLQHVHYIKALQRRVIRVSEMFAEHRSSGDARSDRREWPACP
ncbi:MAG: hypothetical protein J6C35_06280 [Bacteroidales bacterium]|nr:hypothetical protein [Bacteroidales bacterium]